jgi:hypothetical protein
MKALKILVAALVITVPSAAISQNESGIWIIENYYGSVASSGLEVGRKIFYCDGTIVVEGQVTENAYLEYRNECGPRSGGGW